MTRRSLLSFVVALLWVEPSQAAIPANTYVDVRSSAAASNVNGGAFSPAQATATKTVTAATDLVVDSTNNKLVTSAGHTFVSGDVNRFISVTAGTNWDIGNYQVLSISGSGAILDLSPAPTGTTGGTYDLYTGIDYSQQDAAQIAFTDIVVGATTTQGTSVLNPFTTSMEGNAVNVLSGAGCTVQRAVIISVSGITATFDKSLGTAASACTGNLGGSFLTVGAAATFAAVSGNNVFVKSGTYTLTATATFAVVQLLQGYGTNHHDGGTKPLITTATNSTNLITFNSTLTVQNVSLSNTAGTRGALLFCGANFAVVNVDNSILDGGTFGVLGDNSTASAAGLIMRGSEVKNSTTGGIKIWFQIIIDSSYIHDNTGSGVAKTSAQNLTYVVTNSIFAVNTNGIDPANGDGVFTVKNNAFVSNTAAGISNGILGFYENNVFWGNGTWGIAGPPSGIWQSNAFGSNTSGDVSLPAQNRYNPTTNRIKLTASPFVSSTNFALNNTAGGGALLKQAGYPGTFLGGTSTGYMDIGAVQTSGAPGSGACSAAIIN